MKKSLFLLAGSLTLMIGSRVFGQAAHDPWIDRAFREVIGRAPQGNEWNIQNYAHGHWSSYEDLLAKVRARAAGQGIAFIFIEPEQAVYQGHIGWAFMQDDGTYCYGSTENPMKPIKDVGQAAKAVYDALYIPPGQDNGFWYGTCNTQAELMADMKRAGNDRTPSARYPFGFRGNGYWHYKFTYVPTRHAAAAKSTAISEKNSGFKGLTWNCLDQTYAVLEAYGVDKNVVMPWKQDHPSPNYWFNDFGGWNPKNGQAYKGHNTTGAPLF